MSGRVSDPRPPSALREHELLARLGLGPGASNDEVEAAHDEILDYLGHAPGSLRGWARVQLTEADETYARLSGAPIAGYEPEAPAAAVLATAVAGEPVIHSTIDDDFEDYVDPDGPVVITRRDRRATQAQARSAKAVPGKASYRRSSTAPGALVIPGATLRKVVIGGVVLALVAALGLGIYGFNPGGLPGLTGTPEPQATGGLDAAQVSALMQKIAANPKDTVSLMALANLYYGISDYATAETWFQKVLDIDPKNVNALLALGAAQFNGGDETSAQLAWEKVLTIDSKNVEAHYDLGFMYFSQNPPNVEKARAEWGQVIALAPDSDIAKTVATHLAQLGGSPLPSGAPAGSPAAGSPAPASSPAPSPAAS